MMTAAQRIQFLNATDARVFRITHIDNVPWMLDNGLHCQSSGVCDPTFVPIGMTTLIGKRTTHPVPIPPRGVLANYVPFYFTPWSMMLMNITTGYNNVIRRPNSEIVIVAARLHDFYAHGLTTLFTDGHAYMQQTKYFAKAAQLSEVDWSILQNRDFKKSDADPDKSRRYQAEALVHGHVPISAIRGIACNTAAAKARIDAWAQHRGLNLSVPLLPDWYF